MMTTASSKLKRSKRAHSLMASSWPSEISLNHRRADARPLLQPAPYRSKRFTKRYKGVSCGNGPVGSQKMRPSSAAAVSPKSPNAHPAAQNMVTSYSSHRRSLSIRLFSLRRTACRPIISPQCALPIAQNIKCVSTTSFFQCLVGLSLLRFIRRIESPLGGLTPV